MNANPATPPDDRLVSLDYIAVRIGISSREVRRDIPGWPGFPRALKLGHRTVRYSLQEFNRWFEQLKTGGHQPA
jgi:predicted DNA-binding transcriptional regulator AlpA